MNAPWTLRPIMQQDNPALAALIRSVMPEFGASGPGFAINDPEVDAMAEAYAQPGAAYWVVEREGRVVGGGGIAPLEGGPADTCELRKMYFLPELRGQGAGRALIERCLEFAQAAGYRQCYLETLSNMDRAKRLYAAAGFQPLAAALGATGHFGCNAFYLKAL